MEEVPAELILNWDQTGIHILPWTSWMMYQRGLKVSRVSGCTWQESNHSCCFCKYDWRFSPHQTHLEKTEQSVTETISFLQVGTVHVQKNTGWWKECFRNIILPCTEGMRQLLKQKDAVAVVIMGNFGGTPYWKRTSPYLFIATKHCRPPTAPWRFCQQAS